MNHLIRFLNYIHQNDVVRKNGPWNEEETQKLIEIFADGLPNNICQNGHLKWGLLSLCIPGCVGYQCMNQYNKLVKLGFITDIREAPRKPQLFDKYIQPALLSYQEERLSNVIEDMINDKKLVTPCDFCKMAIELYYETSHLAYKAAIIKCINDRVPIFTDFSETSFSNEVEAIKEEMNLKFPLSVLQDHGFVNL